MNTLVHSYLLRTVTLFFLTTSVDAAQPAYGAARMQQEMPETLAQQPADPGAGSPLLIRVKSGLVMVPVSVTDSSGKPVFTLKSSDFKIEEDNRPESIAKMDEPGQTPLNIVLLLDVSGSTNPQFAFEQEAAKRFLEQVFKPGDAVWVSSVAAESQSLQNETHDVATALIELLHLEPTRGMTAFYDSVVDAARMLKRTPSLDARRVLVVLSDGEDNNSMRFRLGDTLREVQRADCIFYAINPGGTSIRLNQISMRAQEGMESLATETGGAAFLPNDPSDLERIFSRISTELRAQYLLGYYSSNPRADGTFRHIVVAVPGRPDLRIRARQGYYAPMG